VKVGDVWQCKGWERSGRLGGGRANGERTMEEKLGTRVVDDGEVDYELEDLHGRYVALPLLVTPNISISMGKTE